MIMVFYAQEEVTKMRITIVEDEQPFADELAEYITRFSQKYQAAVQCQHFKSSVTFLSSYQPVWDLLLLPAGARRSL